MYKFRTVGNETEESTSERNELQTEFVSDLNIVSTIAGIVFLVLTLLFGHHIAAKKRIITSLIVIFISFFVTIVFVLIDTDECKLKMFQNSLYLLRYIPGQQGFLGITLTIAAIISGKLI